MSPRTLREAAAAGFPAPRFLWQERLEHPWCRPEGGAVPVGDTLLVAVRGDAGDLWHLGGDRVDEPEASAAWATAGKVALHAAPVAVALDVDDPPLRAQVVFAETDPGVVPRLTGASFGAAFLLARASRWVEAPVPADLVALATVNEDGRLGPVGGLAVKLRALHDHALAVRRVLVAAGQADEARAVIGGLPDASLEVVAADTAEAAIAIAWPDLSSRRRSEWRADPERAAERARALEARLSDRNPRLPAWAAIRRGCEALAHELSELGPADAARSAAVAAKIALRHEGHGDSRLDWPGADDLPARHDLRVRRLAQVVQSWADDGDPGRAREAAERAGRGLRARNDRGPADLVLAGAIGRAWAAAGDEAQGLAWSLDAVDDWFVLGFPDDSSYAVCEAIRLAAVRRDADAEARLAQAIAWWAVGGRGSSAAYVKAERIRAAVLHGRPSEALALAAEARDGLAGGGQHAPFAVLRWEAIALDHLGRPDDARAQRDAAAQAGHPHPPTAAWLLAVDQGVADGVRGLPDAPKADTEARRCLALYGAGDTTADLVQRAYRY